MALYNHWRARAVAQCHRGAVYILRGDRGDTARHRRQRQRRDNCHSQTAVRRLVYIIFCILYFVYAFLWSACGRLFCASLPVLYIVLHKT